jgi:RND family efflux transporter MFP subunit
MKTYFAVAIAALALLGVLTLSLTGRAKTEDRAEPVRPVRVLKIESVPNKEVSVYSGEIRARFETPMAFRVPGRIAQRHVDVGTAVRKGQPLATLDAADYRLSVQSLRAQLASAEADFGFQTSELTRGSELLEKGFISQTDHDRRHNVYQGAKARLDQARALFAQTQNQSEYTELRALSDGVVTSIDAETGQVVAAGQTVLRVARLEQKEAIINIPENRLDEARSADSIRVALWAEPGKTYHGHLREISPGVDPITRTYTGKVALLDPDASVQIGMTATVTIDRQAGERGRQVPLTALVARDSRIFVWVVDPVTATVDLTAVEIGDYRGNAVAILAGLEDSDYVVIAGVHKLFPHQKVAILQDADR